MRLENLLRMRGIPLTVHAILWIPPAFFPPPSDWATGQYFTFYTLLLLFFPPHPTALITKNKLLTFQVVPSLEVKCIRMTTALRDQGTLVGARFMGYFRGHPNTWPDLLPGPVHGLRRTLPRGLPLNLNRGKTKIYCNVLYCNFYYTIRYCT